MTESSALVTWDALLTLGFKPDHEVISDIEPGLSYDFKICKLKASCCINMRFAPIVLFTGVAFNGRILSEFCFEMTRNVESVEQCAAIIVWNLDKHSPFRAISNPDWLVVGRQSFRLLPWRK